jgi:hypothetical protein
MQFCLRLTNRRRRQLDQVVRRARSAHVEQLALSVRIEVRQFRQYDDCALQAFERMDRLDLHLVRAGRG